VPLLIGKYFVIEYQKPIAMMDELQGYRSADTASPL
jgi:hypothetical protein